nr:unnamed protein product [Callosobruchus chinensis]
MNEKASSAKDAKETFQCLMELSNLLGADLDPEVLSICVRLCESGVNPELLATVLKDILKEVQTVRQEE